MLNPLRLRAELERVGTVVERDLIGNIGYTRDPVAVVTAASSHAGHGRGATGTDAAGRNLPDGFRPGIEEHRTIYRNIDQSSIGRPSAAEPKSERIQKRRINPLLFQHQCLITAGRERSEIAVVAIRSKNTAPSKIIAGHQKIFVG